MLLKTLILNEEDVIGGFDSNQDEVARRIGFWIKKLFFGGFFGSKGCLLKDFFYQ